MNTTTYNALTALTAFVDCFPVATRGVVGTACLNLVADHLMAKPIGDTCPENDALNSKPKPITASRPKTKRKVLQPGLATSCRHFEEPILRILRDNVVSSAGVTRSEVFTAIANNSAVMGPLNSYDHEMLSKAKMVRWRKTVDMAKLHLTKAGLCESSQPGWWRITPKGLDFLAEIDGSLIKDPNLLF